MMRLLYALRFLTILPIPYRQDEDLRQMARSSVWFPLVGLVIGAMLAGTHHLASSVGLDTAAPVLTTLMWILLTGGLHLDGLADTADGLGGGRTREQRLEIMKDSRIGSFGTLALIGQILLKVTLIHGLADELITPALLIAPMAGRSIVLFTFRIFPAARPGGMGDFFQKNGTWAEPIVGILYSLTAAWLLLDTAGSLILPAAGIIILPYCLFLTKRLGGLTGDCYGSIIEILEVLILLAISIAYTTVPGVLG